MITAYWSHDADSIKIITVRLNSTASVLAQKLFPKSFLYDIQTRKLETARQIILIAIMIFYS